ncbi:MAG: ribonuclease P protein component [Candidatus Omnitrophica bacterium]|nr:ribonuclease P protein component [Candidatus Omnitrophota bacterium]
MPKLGFEKRERLLKHSEYKAVYQGRFCRNAFFILRFIPNNKRTNRVGFIIKKKYFRLAVSRNRLRRLLREAYRLHKPEIRGNFDIVIIAQKANLPLNYKEAEKRLMSLFKKAGLCQ